MPDGVRSGAFARSSGVAPSLDRSTIGNRDLTVEVLPQPRAFAYSADHRAECCSIPSDLGDPPVIRNGMQLQRNVLRVWKALHRRVGKDLLEKCPPLESNPVQCRGVLTLQMNADRTRRAADSAEQIAFRRERARIRQADDDLLANDTFRALRCGSRPAPAHR